MVPSQKVVESILKNGIELAEKDDTIYQTTLAYIPEIDDFAFVLVPIYIPSNKINEIATLTKMVLVDDYKVTYTTKEEIDE